MLIRRLAFAVMLAACSGAVDGQSGPATSSVASSIPFVAGCETLLDAGTPCEACPGNVESTQTDYPNVQYTDAGQAYIAAVNTMRFCRCPPRGAGHAIGVAWEACPPVPAGTIPDWPATTCAESAKEFVAACAE